jgi:DNA polymerase III epsilon subunit-like protein
MNTFYGLDFEGSLQSGVLEVGVVALEAGELGQCFSKFYAPKGMVSDQEVRVHGLNPASLQGEKDFQEDWELFRNFRQKGLWVAHHAATENAFLTRAWPHPGVMPLPSSALKSTSYEWGPWVDTHAIYRSVYKGLPSYQLMDLIDTFGLGQPLYRAAKQVCPAGRVRPHAALFDALAAVFLVKNLVKDFGDKAYDARWLLEKSLPRKAFDTLFGQRQFEFSY